MRVNSIDLQNSFCKYLKLTQQEEIIVLISYDEFLRYVDFSDQRLELIDGEIHPLSLPSFLH